ncbi:hypothetical protein [Lewinella sp. 4G2]|uniref:hypothetical protein n=1 Tax=Lewinella sp. 4G2 TaxID=1803372 RepID=UPI0007B46034|nr:hypothetical protein [Lewinella sp. 4G2]OAV44609.1 hypothetical protein A3850_008940 [Lewinella sp. 4G2]
MPKTKLTGFSRLLLFLLIFLPLAYFGASYYNGEDPIGKIKGMFGQTESGGDEYNNHRPESDTYDPNSTTEKPATFENVSAMRSEITDLKQKLAVAEEKLARCQTENVQ